MKKPAPSLQMLEREAFRVAREMASLRSALLGRLSGSSKSPVRAEPPGNSPGPERGDQRAGFSPFYYYPFLFATAFPAARVEDLRTLALANRILLEAILLTDQKVDENRPWAPVDFCLVDGYFQQALTLLVPLFPLDHGFWQTTQEWFLQHGRAVLKEQARHRHRFSSYSRDEFYEIATGKVALLKTNLLAMALLSGNMDPLPPLMEAQDRFLAGFQCFDDLRDWKEDLRHGNLTFLLTRVLVDGRRQGGACQGKPICRDRVGEALYHQGFAEEQLRLAEQYFGEALDAAKNVHVPDWKKTVRGFLRHCRTMRHDLTEIRRRTEKGTRRKGLETSLAEALDFLVRSVPSAGGIPLTRSPNPYLHPATAAAPSRFATSLFLQALTPLQNMDCRLPTLLRKVSRWPPVPSGPPQDPALPACLEDSFPLYERDTRSLLESDPSLDDTLPLHRHGLYWANLLLTASRQNLRLRNLEGIARATVRSGDYRRWTRSASAELDDSSEDQSLCHPLLILLLLCQALGPDLPEEPAHDYLLRRNRATGSWNQPTEIALRLLCLVGTGYHGPELAPGVERLLRTQEPDGSWPPNALHEGKDGFYGSRELTTAWCTLALFLYRTAAGRQTPGRGLTETHKYRAPATKIVLHKELPLRLRPWIRSVLNEIETVIAPPWPHTLCIGTWAGMPPHFLLKTEHGLLAGVNTLSHRRKQPVTTGSRPLRVEILMATLSARRCLEHGPLKDRLERIFVAGLALSVSGRLWPGMPPWSRLGMRKLDWSWCREQEAFLWQELRRFLLHPLPGKPEFEWLLPDPPASSFQPIPKGAALFLGEKLLADPDRQDDPLERVNDLLGKGLPDILRTFRRKAGLGSGENSFL